MAINKNFVVKNGLEVSTDLILADANRNKVGIGSTEPRTLLDVRGGIAATDVYISGYSTVANIFNVGTFGNVFTALGIGGSVGVGTNTPDYLFHVNSPVSTGQTAIYIKGDGRLTGDLRIDGDLFADDVTLDQAEFTYLNVTGFGTINSLFVPIEATIKTGVVTNISGTNLNYTGVGTIQNLNVTGVTTLGISNVSELNVSGVSTFVGILTNTSTLFANQLNVAGASTFSGITTVTGSTLFSNQLSVSGISTFQSAKANSIETINLHASGITTLSDLSITRSESNTLVVNEFSRLSGLSTIDNATGTNINFSGIGSIGGFLFSSGIVTSTSLGAGIVTYYGDGSQLQFLPTASPEGSNTQVQFNAAGVFSGHPGFTYDYHTVTISGLRSGISTLGIATATSLRVSGIATAQDFDALSDINFKENIFTINNALDKISNLRGVRFDWKESGKSSYGVIAQELQEVLPELVHGNDPKTVNYNGIIGVLIEAIKELKNEIEILKKIRQ